MLLFRLINVVDIFRMSESLKVFIGKMMVKGEMNLSEQSMEIEKKRYIFKKKKVTIETKEGLLKYVRIWNGMRGWEIGGLALYDGL